jgi:predicted nucleotidyltransferase
VMARRQDQALVDRFVRELVKDVVRRFPSAIDFVILFGSAARGEFMPGVSDIDLLIQTKQDKHVKIIERAATVTFWKLNKRLRTGFEKSCATKKPRTLAGRVFGTLERRANLYTPIFVFGPNDLDWSTGRVRKPSLYLPAHLIVSQAGVFHKFKTEGKVYYGRDIRKEIQPGFSWWERWKGIMIPQHLAAFALVISPFFPAHAAKYCNKAILYDIDSALLYMNRIGKHSKKQKILQLAAASGLATKEFDIVTEALRYKKKGFSGNAVSYALRTFWFVLRLNFGAVMHTI